jgi:TonB-dependent SusC/RagA subfamily outer membrane receptor
VEKPVKGQKVINVQMTDEIQAIDEVVVTAIGIKQQKKKIGYTTQQVNTEALDQPGTVNVGNALSGQVAGLTVNNPTGIFQAPTFTLRKKTPLMEIDGVPVESDLFDVSPENIQSINVLKGTAAAALYGSRGKDGAILITTKLADKEGLTVKAGLSSMVTAGFTVFPETQTEFGSGSNGQYAFWDGADGGISDGDMTWGPRFEGQKIAQWNSPIRNKETGEVIPWWGDVSGTIYDDQSKYERVPITWEAHDNLKDFLQTGIITKATFSVASKSKKANYNFNGDFSHQKGQVPNTAVYTGG